MPSTASSLTYLFLDTEWADEKGLELVSIALVSEDGANTFYAERDPLPLAPTEFVRTTVYPLLQRGGHALPDQSLAMALVAFLRAQRYPHVIADHPNDLGLFRQVISWHRPGAVCRLEELPSVPCTLMERDRFTTSHLERWFSKHPDLLLRRHHALVDANALRMAWMVSTGRLDDNFNERE
ncbi:3'-5' exoribonuclease|nr:3'-5' exoribonuclease [Stenotrophomonas sp. SbOxS2]NYT97654.1 3'-5' exoribonuclease [Stenotrophomonas sp. SbOxS2]